MSFIKVGKFEIFCVLHAFFNTWSGAGDARIFVFFLFLYWPVFDRWDDNEKSWIQRMGHWNPFNLTPGTFHMNCNIQNIECSFSKVKCFMWSSERRVDSLTWVTSQPNDLISVFQYYLNSWKEPQLCVHENKPVFAAEDLTFQPWVISSRAVYTQAPEVIDTKRLKRNISQLNLSHKRHHPSLPVQPTFNILVTGNQKVCNLLKFHIINNAEI